jgi:hypothetical protein
MVAGQAKDELRAAAGFFLDLLDLLDRPNRGDCDRHDDDHNDDD